ncbi:hypothetical protein X777_14320 [Ooceraea biroi]|uniref:Odorant receptor n=1 Tax=Ooceraea biroi TaxID=2015173 RepID=A0A026VWI7_OOCBI|nr:hypothetical protein X777_14320 [Ooceraea biroi]
MICIQTQDFNINRILLLLIGLWPYQRSKMVHFQVILFFGIMACSVILQAITLCGLLIFISLTIWPRIIDIDIVLLINDSQPCHARHAIITEYFLDEERYFYLVLLQMYVTFFIGGFTMTATGTMLLGYIKYICGMFKIASYRIEQAMQINIFDRIYLRDKAEIHKEIIRAVDIHCKAMEFANFLISNFQDTFVMSQLFNVLCLSLNLYCVFQADSFKDNVDEFLLHFMLANGIFVYSFVANYAGQEIIDHYNYIFSAACNIQWYVAPLRTQKLILFLLQRGNTIFNLRIAGVFTGSFECFATMTKQAISYFTVIYSTQQ